MAIEEIGSTQGVAITLEKEHRHPNRGQVIDAKAVGLAGRMKGIAVTNHPSHIDALRRQVGPHPSPHRSPRQVRSSRASIRKFGQGRPVSGEKTFGGVRSTSAHLGVGIVEGHNSHSSCCQGRAGGHHHRVLLVSARPMGEEDAPLPHPFDFSGDDIAVDLDLQGSSHRRTLGDSLL